MIQKNDYSINIHMRSTPVTDKDLPKKVVCPDSPRSLVSVSSEASENEVGATVETINAPMTGRTRCVSFSSIVIREYEVVPGDNPSVVTGCPLSLGWEYELRFNGALNDYEATKLRTRDLSELRTTPSSREATLRSFGFSRVEIQERAKLATVARRQRLKTIETLQLARFEELVEKAKRTVFGGSRRREERNLLTKSASLDSLVALNSTSTKRALK